MSKITMYDNGTNLGVTCGTCRNFHDARRCICKSWCEATAFYARDDDAVCARYVARDETRDARL